MNVDSVRMSVVKIIVNFRSVIVTRVSQSASDEAVIVTGVLQYH